MKRKQTDVITLFCRSTSLPVPVREYRFATPRRWRFDYAWPDRLLALEIEGGVYVGGRHTRGAGYEADCVKYTEAAVLGWRVLRVTPNMLRDGRAVRFVERVLGDA